MNLAHLHLLINHFPTVGSVLGVGLFLIALAAKSDELKRAGLVVFFFIALLTIPAYMSGNAAEELLRGSPGIPRALIEAHRDAAQLALALVELTGVVAWFGLWRLRRKGSLGGAIQSSLLVLSLVTVGVVGYAANIGGGIRHPEIEQADLSSPGAAKAILETAQQNLKDAQRISETITTGKSLTGIGIGAVGELMLGEWAWPVCETLHFVGLSLLMGVVLLIDLRMLGLLGNVEFQTLHRLLPWGILGFGLNVLTGMLFFAGKPAQYTTNTPFQYKMVLVVIAGLNALYFTVFDEMWTLKAGDDAPFMAKAMASSALLVWAAVLFCGSMMPFIGRSF